jgi:hypothetical protein
LTGGFDSKTKVAFDVCFIINKINDIEIFEKMNLARSHHRIIMNNNKQILITGGYSHKYGALKATEY